MGKHVELTDSMYALLEARALEEGLSPGEYLARLLERDRKQPNWDAITARMAKYPAIDLNDEIVRILREERQSR